MSASSWLVVLGLMIMLTGLWLIHWPVALVVLGAVMLFVGLWYELPPRSRG